MKISCVLTSYNRPKWVRHALKSVADQTHRDYQLVVVDESTVFDVRESVAEFGLPEAEVHRFKVPAAQRASQNRLGINLNFGVSRATGDILCFLCDDDYYYPGWFAAVSDFFEKNPKVWAGFGKLLYTESRKMVFEGIEVGDLRFHDKPLGNPFYKIDHNQVAHRRFDPPVRWTEDPKYVDEPDAHYFRDIARRHMFHPIDAMAAVKRRHKKCLQHNVEAIRSGVADEIRE